MICCWLGYGSGKKFPDPAKRAGTERRCKIYILIIFALFQQPDVHDDTQDCDVQHGYRHCAH